MKLANVFGTTTAALFLAAGAALAQQGTPQLSAPQESLTPGLGPIPWFAKPFIQQQLMLPVDQYAALIRTYGDAWVSYQTNLGKLGNDLTLAERSQKMNQLQAALYQTVDSAVDRLITNAAQRLRFNQLRFQQQGYAAFNDPVIKKKLHLTS